MNTYENIYTKEIIHIAKTESVPINGSQKVTVYILSDGSRWNHSQFYEHHRSLEK